MNFIEAVIKVYQGHNVTRTSLLGFEVLVLNMQPNAPMLCKLPVSVYNSVSAQLIPSSIDSIFNYSPSYEDVLATDWQVVENKEDYDQNWKPTTYEEWQKAGK